MRNGNDLRSLHPAISPLRGDNRTHGQADAPQWIYDTHMNENPSIISHVSLGTNDFERSAAFFDRVLAVLGCKRIVEHPGAIAWGKLFPELWLQTPINGEPATCGNGTHVALVAASPEQVRAFWEAACAAGAQPDGEPGPRAEYGKPYYGCFVRDPNGHKIEATFWDVTLM